MSTGRPWVFTLTILSLFTNTCIGGSALPFYKHQSKVLVLGSGGLIGSALVEELHSQGYSTIEVLNRRHVDLRNQSQFLDFVSREDPEEAIGFVFFLACEVGGSKFLTSKSTSTQLSIIESNIQMYQTLFPWLSSRRIPFIFTSSSLQSQESGYGTIKRLGEQWIRASGFGKSVRLWNVYGKEKFGPRSRVITDWIISCLVKGHISSLTDGIERRQFLYTEDCAKALVILMEQYPHVPEISDISSYQWTDMKALGNLIVSYSPAPCTIDFSDSKV